MASPRGQGPGDAQDDQKLVSHRFGRDAAHKVITYRKRQVHCAKN